MLGVSCLVLGTIWSVYGKYNMVKSNGDKMVDDKYFIDIWTLGHIITHTIYVLIINYFLNIFWLSFIISYILGFLFEIIESKMALNKSLEMYREKPINSFGDVIIGGTIGGLLAYLFI